MHQNAADRFFLFSAFLIVYYSLGVHSGWVNTLVDVSLKKSIFIIIAKKLQILNSFKGESSKINFLNKKVYHKNYKKLEKIFFGNVRVFTEHLEHPEDTPQEGIPRLVNRMRLYFQFHAALFTCFIISSLVL